MVSGARSSWFTATEWHAENLSAGSEPRPGPGYGMTEPESESDQPVSSEQGRAFSGDCDWGWSCTPTSTWHLAHWSSMLLLYQKYSIVQSESGFKIYWSQLLKLRILNLEELSKNELGYSSVSTSTCLLYIKKLVYCGYDSNHKSYRRQAKVNSS